MKNNQPIYKTILISAVLLFIIYFVFYFWLDIPILSWVKQNLFNTFLFSSAKVISLIFKPGIWVLLGIIILLIGYFFHNKPIKKYYLLSFSVLLAYAVCGVLKFVLARYRPVEFFTNDLYGFHFFSYKAEFTSTPSGATATAFAALVALAVIENKRSITILLMIIAIIIALSRIILTEHYPSDVIFGAYIGILAVYACRYFIARKITI